MSRTSRRTSTSPSFELSTEHESVRVARIDHPTMRAAFADIAHRPARKDRRRRRRRHRRRRESTPHAAPIDRCNPVTLLCDLFAEGWSGPIDVVAREQTWACRIHSAFTFWTAYQCLSWAARAMTCGKIPLRRPALAAIATGAGVTSGRAAGLGRQPTRPHGAAARIPPLIHGSRPPKKERGNATRPAPRPAL